MCLKEIKLSTILNLQSDEIVYHPLQPCMYINVVQQSTCTRCIQEMSLSPHVVIDLLYLISIGS